MKGKLRKNIITLVEDKLSEDDLCEIGIFIDDIERAAQDAADIFDDIRGIDDLHKIEDAKKAIDELADALY
ncbi:MAG: hypothetical protein ACN2B6_01235 [Rickettsiales bacterium]